MILTEYGPGKPRGRVKDIELVLAEKWESLNIGFGCGNGNKKVDVKDAVT